MNDFRYVNGRLHCANVALETIADAVGTPFYCYSHETLTRHYRAFHEGFRDAPHVIAFSVKALSNLSVLRLLGSMGCGADVVSGGELYRALEAGIPAERIVYSGVGKTAQELEYALRTGILMFNVESSEELAALADAAARLDVVAPVSLRVNPDVDPKTHKYIATGLRESKFGIAIDLARESYARAAAMTSLRIVGVDCHIGSQLTDLAPIRDALSRLERLIGDLRADGHEITHLDIGGGLGISYDDEAPPHPTEYAKAVLDTVAHLGLTLVMEPGRVIVGNAGVLVTRLLYRKRQGDKRFLIVDAGMNDLIRPSLYDSFHEIRPVRETAAPRSAADVVGPVCESGDFLARDREMPDDLERGELLAVMSAGAYGFAMSSNYNSRPRAAEVLVRGERFAVVRRRETYEDLVGPERVEVDL
ncbi:MAG: diaminopimelate decarboxylase [Deltaproteobacteria bacterium]|nr:diaminopimelate decarboxylase [Deltaproteobacteria bacterium]